MNLWEKQNIKYLFRSTGADGIEMNGCYKDSTPLELYENKARRVEIFVEKNQNRIGSAIGAELVNMFRSDGADDTANEHY
ncbi:MAG: hypothetical protein IPM42_11145 [Saprospiraceae bacterium]|nr:hypothetical protein [Saprospiraceae bacterium]